MRCRGSILSFRGQMRTVAWNKNAPWLNYDYLVTLFVFLSCPCSPLWSVCVIPDIFERCGRNLRWTHSTEHAAVVSVWLPLWWGFRSMRPMQRRRKPIFFCWFVIYRVFSPFRRVSSSEYWEPDHNKIHHRWTRKCKRVPFCLPRSVINRLLLLICPASLFIYLFGKNSQFSTVKYNLRSPKHSVSMILVHWCEHLLFEWSACARVRV